jgi:hypothetical protein
VGQGEAPKRWLRQDRLRLVSSEELRDFAIAAGLIVERVAGDYGLGELGPGSERAILVATKPLRRRPSGRLPTLTASGRPSAQRARTGTSGRMADPVAWYRRADVRFGPDRLLLVEDVPQVTQHIRSLLNAQTG